MSEQKKNIRQWLTYAIKALVTLSLCVFILYQLDWKAVKETVIGADYTLLLLVTLCMFFNIVLCAYKWRFLLQKHGIKLSLYQLSRYYFTGMFFSNFLPSIVGGDAYRIYKIYTLNKSKSAAIIPVFMERFVGILALLVVGLVGAVGSYFIYGDRISLLAILLSGGALVFTLAVSFIARLDWVKRFFYERIKVPGKIKLIMERLAIYDFKDSRMILVFLLSVLFYIFLIIYRLLLFHAFDANCGVFSLAMIIMVSTLAASIPISLNGIGLLEGSFVFLISQYGVNYEAAVMVMLMQRFFVILLSLLGGIAYYFDKKDLKEVQEVAKKLRPATNESGS